MKKTMTELLMILPLALLSGQGQYTQSTLESAMVFAYEEIVYTDNYEDDDGPDLLPSRERDAIRDYCASFVTKGGWTTNQIIAGMIESYSNNIPKAVTGDERSCIVASTALYMLSRINNPTANDFIKITITNDLRATSCSEPLEILPGIFVYSNFEPEVMNYMRNVCVMTNLYDGGSSWISGLMCRCATNAPLPYRANAITNVAKFIHFEVAHITQEIASTEIKLIRLFPEYLDSVQRLQNIQYIANTATNVLEREWAIRERDRLTAMPTNELNNLNWLLEDYK